MKTKRTVTLMLVVFGLLLGRDALAFYNPSTGRWLSRDPVGERGGLNVYAHTRNRPTLSFDRLGQQEDRHSAEGDSVAISFQGSSGSGQAGVSHGEEPICRAREVQVKVTLDFGGGETLPDDQAASKFSCDGTPATVDKSTDWPNSKVVVVCKKQITVCPDGKATGRITFKGEYDKYKPEIDWATVTVTWNYACNPCCEAVEPFTHTTKWKGSGNVFFY